MDTPTRVAYKVPEAALALSLSEATVWKLVGSGAIRSYTVGSARFVPVRALDEFIDARLAAEASSRRESP
ncbi:helix-turn-helix domain-containing protein [Nocardiopsis alba]|uniref:helix-turn-helix domain-containing protein n=1 Tax=Nocardiopsis alba TaxID=53437 RepID=UPI0036CDFC9D